MSRPALDLDESLHYSTLTWDSIKPSLTEGESALYNTKWWDYRFLHPMEATYLFAAEYVKAYTAVMRRRVDIKRVGNIRPLKNKDFLKCDQKVITGMWKARRYADACGIPYNFWCIQALVYAEVMNWNYMPKPFQLYVNNAKGEGFVTMVEFVLRSWDERQQSVVQHATHPFYVAPTSPMHPYQIAHARMLMKRVNAAAHKPALLWDLVYNKRLLPEGVVLKSFGKESGGNLLQQARSLAA